MPSALGQLITRARKSKGFSLRELARRIAKSTAFVAMIEKNDPRPGIAEETLSSIADVLELNRDRLITLAGKTPHDVVPADELEVAIYRLVKMLDSGEKRTLLRRLQDHVKEPA